MARFNCPECGSSNTSCTYDDGGGDFGESIIECWVCEDCDAEWDFDMGYEGDNEYSSADDDPLYAGEGGDSDGNAL